jgi:hypothetical protein
VLEGKICCPSKTLCIFRRRKTVRYLLLIYENEAAHAQFSQSELGAEFEAYKAFTAEVQQRGVFLSIEALMPVNTATTVRVRDGKTPRSRLAAACSILQRGRPGGATVRSAAGSRKRERGRGRSHFHAPP